MFPACCTVLWSCQVRPSGVQLQPVLLFLVPLAVVDSVDNSVVDSSVALL